MISFLKGRHTQKICPKTGKIVESKPKNRLFWWLFPITGLAALIWFLIRVIPKPSRALYPCQKVAFPLASGFVAWIIGFIGSAAAYRKAKHHISRARYVMAAICLTASVSFIWMAMSYTDEEPVSAHEPIVHNSPIGTARGVHPGRVAWIHDANATSWTGSDGSNYTQPWWHADASTNPQIVAEMFSKGLRALAGEYTDEAAWNAIFRYFNQQHGRGDVGYTPGEKIAIKINFVLMNDIVNSGAKNTNYYDQIDNSPQLTIALLNQLTEVAGVTPGDISIGDPTQHMPDYWFNKVEPNCADGIVYLTKPGWNLSGRTQCAFDNNSPFYWSDPCTAHFSGVTDQDYIPTHFSQATYFINFSILKSHNGAGITLSGKNHFGSLIRKPPASGGYTPAKHYYDMHWSRLGATESPGMGYYRAVVDLLSHPRLGGKTMLFLMDGLYAGRSWDSHPIRWDMAPFGGDWPSSIFLSQDPVAIDSVAFDFMDYEWDDAPNNINGYPQMTGADDYLHEAAKIPNPDSGTTYDPNHDGSITESLGVHEHWDNATNKRYSRNIDPVNGTGIELVTAPPVDNPNIDFIDFTSFAKAWRTSQGEANWDPNWDISIPPDDVINEDDLVIFAESWLKPLITGLIGEGASLTEVYYENTIGFEGATWDPNSDKLFFTRRLSPWRILRLDSPGSATVWLDSAPQTNGMLISLEGRLLACDEVPMQVSSRSIGSSGPGDTIILSDSSDGYTNKPNDLCQLANGNIYFTTPTWSGGGPSVQGVWLLRSNGTVTRVNNTLNQPNGIITSLDETKLYVSEGSTTSANQRWVVFNINSDGSLSAPTQFFKPSSPPDVTNVPDGMTIDQFGNLYFTGLGGVWIVSPAGVQLGFITVYAPFNICFGGTDGKTLYITAKNRVWSLQMQVKGGELENW